MDRILDIIKESSLSASMSPTEIEEIWREIEDEVESIIDEEKESIDDAHEKRHTKDSNKIEELQQKIEDFELALNNTKTLTDELTLEWVHKNWEQLVSMQQNGFFNDFFEMK